MADRSFMGPNLSDYARLYGGEQELPDYGYGPVTPMSRDGYDSSNSELRAAAPMAFLPPWLRGVLTYGPMPAQAYIDSVDQAGEAVAGAMRDPSIPNVGNAMARAALVTGNPMAIMAATGGAYTAAGAADLFRTYIGSAHAGRDDIERRLRAMPRDQLIALQRDVGVNADGVVGPGTIGAVMNAEQQKEANAAREDARVIAIEAERAKAAANAAATAQTEQRSEVGRRVDAAKQSLMSDLTAAREPQRDESFTGQLYEQLGVLTPLAAGMAGGAMARLAKPAIGSGNKFVDDYLNPFLMGSEAGGAVALAPTWATANRSDPTNPEYRAWQLYRTRLPAEAEAEMQAADERLLSVPPIDPAVSQARDDLRSPSVRGMSMLQGGLGGLIGNNGMAALGQVPGRIAQLPGRVVRGFKEGFNPGAGRNQPPSATTGGFDAPAPLEGSLGTIRPPSATEYRHYPDLPESSRNALRKAYIGAVAVEGRLPNAAKASNELRSQYERYGVNAPITKNRVGATNDAVAAFERQHGRMPASLAEWSSIFSKKTLAVPLAAGAGAASQNYDEWGNSQ